MWRQVRGLIAQLLILGRRSSYDYFQGMGRMKVAAILTQEITSTRFPHTQGVVMNIPRDSKLDSLLELLHS